MYHYRELVLRGETYFLSGSDDIATPMDDGHSKPMMACNSFEDARNLLRQALVAIGIDDARFVDETSHRGLNADNDVAFFVQADTKSIRAQR